MSHFSIIETPIAGLKVIERKPISDSRGYLTRLFCADQIKNAGWQKFIVQINQTVTLKKGTVRGMHFQNRPYAEMKLVSCLRGEIWDVGVDLRRNSPTFLKWHAERLSAENCRSLLIPEGFAHGFQTLTNDCELIYFHSAPYTANAELGIQPTDPRINVRWPLIIQEISIRDSEHPLLDDKFLGIEV